MGQTNYRDHMEARNAVDSPRIVQARVELVRSARIAHRKGIGAKEWRAGATTWMLDALPMGEVEMLETYMWG